MKLDCSMQPIGRWFALPSNDKEITVFNATGQALKPASSDLQRGVYYASAVPACLAADDAPSERQLGQPGPA